MAFDPDAYAASSASAFNPDAYVASVSKNGGDFNPDKYGDNAVALAAKSIAFDPVSHVADNPGDNNARQFAIDVQRARAQNGHDWGTEAKAAVTGIIPAVTSLAKGAGGVVSNLYGAIKEGIAYHASDSDEEGQKHLNQNLAHRLAIEGALQSGTAQAGETALQGKRLIEDYVFQGTPSRKDLDDKEIGERLDNSAALRRIENRGAQGNIIGHAHDEDLTPDQLRASGASVASPEQVQDMSAILNPINAIPFGEGAAVGRVLARVPEAAAVAAGKAVAAGARATGRDAGTAAAIGEKATIRAQQVADAMSKAPQQVIGGALQAVGVSGQTAGNIAKAVSQNPVVQEVAPIVAAGGVLAANSDDPADAAWKALVAYGSGRIGTFGLSHTTPITSARTARVFGGIAAAGKAVREGIPNPLAGRGALAGVVSDAASAVGRGAAGGAAIGAASQLGNDQPGAIGAGAGGGLALGAAGATLGHATSKQALNAYFSASRDPNLRGILNTKPVAYGVDPALDALHNTAMGRLSGSQQASINIRRNLSPDEEVYVLPKDEFIKRAGQDSSGVYYGDVNGRRVTLLNEDTVALDHELGHSIQDDMAKNDPARLESLKRNAKPEDVQSFIEDYNKRLLADNPNATPLDPKSPAALNEYLAEQIQLSLAGKSVGQLGVKSSFGTRMVGAVGRAVERLTGQTLADAKSNLGAKPSFVSDKLIHDYLDQKAKSAANGEIPTPTGEPNATPSRTTEEPQAGTPAQPVGGEAQENAAAPRQGATARALARAVVASGEGTDFQHALGSAADAVAEGKLNGHYDILTYLRAHLSDSGIWRKMNDSQRQAMADFVFHSPDEVFDIFDHPNLTPPAAVAPARAEVPEEVAPGMTPDVEPAAEASETTVVPARRVTPNIRVGPGRAPTGQFEAPNEEEYRPGQTAPGLKVATERKLQSDGTVTPVQKDYYVGSGFDRSNPAEVEMLDRAAIHAPNPPEFKTNVASVEDAIQNGHNISFNYSSAERTGEGSPTRKESETAQDRAKVGLLSRATVEKTFTPLSIRVYPDRVEPVFTPQSIQNAILRARDYYDKAEGKRNYRPPFPTVKEAISAIREIGKNRAANKPIGEYELKQAEKIHDWFDKEPRPVILATGYSQDKVIANAQNLSKALKDSKLEKSFPQEAAYVASKEISGDLATRNLNQAHGYRGDGQPFLDAQGNSSADASYTPKVLPDWKIQVLNALEGGPSVSYYQEHNANAPTAGRAPIENPKAQGGNPFLNALKERGDALVIQRQGGPIAGVNNILDKATETIRLDRMGRVHGKSDITTPPSNYTQRSAAFMPKAGEAPNARRNAPPKRILAGALDGYRSNQPD